MFISLSITSMFPQHVIYHVPVLLTRVLDLLESVEFDQKPDEKSRQVLAGTRATAWGRENKWHVGSLCLRGVVSWYLKWGEGRGRSVVRLQEWLGWSAHCLAVHASCGVHVQYPAFISVSEWQLSFWSFCILFIICPNWAYTQLFLVPCSLFVFCCLRRCLSRYKHGSHLPRWLSGKEPAWHCRNCRRLGFSSWVGKTPWRKKWQLRPVFLLG